MFLKVILLFVVLCCVYNAQCLDLSGIQGSYTSGCSALEGLPSSYRVDEYLSISGDIGYYVTFLYSSTTCDTDPLLRYDRVVQLSTGNRISSSDWTGPTTFQSPTVQLSQQHIKKIMTPLSSEGVDFVDTACPEQSWADGVSRDVLDETCVGFFYACASSSFTEFSCVTQGSSGQLSFCARSATGSCTASDRQLNYFTNGNGGVYVYTKRSKSAVTEMSNLAGDYKQTCSQLFGLPADWRISESASYQSNGRIHIVNTVYSDTSCNNVALKYDRTVQGYFGADTSYPYQAQYPILNNLREFAQYYAEKKYTDISTAGAGFLNTLCPLAHNWVPTNSIDITNLDCPPFTPSCAAGDHWEYIQLGQGVDGGVLRYANNPTPDYSCSPAGYSLSLIHI